MRHASFKGSDSSDERSPPRRFSSFFVAPSVAHADNEWVFIHSATARVRALHEDEEICAPTI
jgi:hypothetical protein